MLMLVISKSYQIYNNGAVSSQLTVVGGGGGGYFMCWLESESVEGVPVERKLQVLGKPRSLIMSLHKLPPIKNGKYKYDVTYPFSLILFASPICGDQS